MLLVVYFGINNYISEKTTTTLKEDTLFHSTQLLGKEVEKIDLILLEINHFVKLMQKNHTKIFENPNYYNIQDVPKFSIATNGVFYKETTSGASLYYSSKTKINEKERNKAIYTEAMDPLLKNIVELSPNIVAAYFNSYDDMNRLYPYIDKVYEQYGEHIHMEDYNFYYLADKKHNPARGTVWTEAYLDPAGNGWMISAIVPIYKNDFLEGVSGLDVTIESLVSNVLEKELPFDGKMFLVDTKGMILAMPESIEKLLGLAELKKHIYTHSITETVIKPEEFNLFINESPFVQPFKSMIQNNIKNSEILIHKDKYFVLNTTVEQTGWKLFTIIKEEKVLKSPIELKAFSNFIGYLAIAFMALFYIIFFVILFRKAKNITDIIASPIDSLSTLTSTILVDRSQKIVIPKTHIKEIHNLSNNFFKMSNELDSRTEKLIQVELEKQKKEKEVKKYYDQSMTDPLTKLYNRNKVDCTLPMLLDSYANKNKEIFSLIYLDIDYFKSINDTYGHQKGDEVLTVISSLLTSNTRESDIVCRIGGEEFLIITENNLEVTKAMAEHLRKIIESADFKIDGTVTCSFGVSEVQLNDTAITIIERADKALYEAKATGRNKVISSSPL